MDKSVAVVGGELITLSEVEQEVQMMSARGFASDRNIRCEILENMMRAKLFLMQSRLDSLTVDQEMVEAQLAQQMDQVRTALGGDEGVAEYFGKPVYKLRQEWRKQIEESTLTQKEQQEIAKNIPEVTPYDVKMYIDTSAVDKLPVVPIKYKMSQICLYPDKDSESSTARSSPPSPACIRRTRAAHARAANWEWPPSPSSGPRSRMRRWPSSRARSPR